MARNLTQNWWEPRPLSEDDMKAEIAMSQIKGPPSQELTPEAIAATLKDLNLNPNRYGPSTNPDAS